MILFRTLFSPLGKHVVEVEIGARGAVVFPFSSSWRIRRAWWRGVGVHQRWRCDVGIDHRWWSQDGSWSGLERIGRVVVQLGAILQALAFRVEHVLTRSLDFLSETHR